MGNVCSTFVEVSRCGRKRQVGAVRVRPVSVSQAPLSGCSTHKSQVAATTVCLYAATHR